MPQRKRTAPSSKGTQRPSKTKRGRDEVHYQRFSSAGKVCRANARFNLSKATAFFDRYKDAESDSIGTEGMLRLCDDLCVDPESMTMLILAWQLGAKQMGVFSRSEWNVGMQKLNVDSLEALRTSKLSGLVDSPADFKELFRYSFDFARCPEQKGLDIATAVQMLRLLLGQSWPELDDFLRFLEQANFKGINRDQWINIYDFSATIKPDHSNYDENGAWPVMLDEYVSWKREQTNQSSVSS